MVYAWHPFYGQEVTIHGERNRRGTVVFACSIGEDPKKAPLEVPAWMLDGTVCRIFRQAASARVTVEALRLLRRTLDAAANVIEAQHRLIAVGGSDAPTNQDRKDAAQPVCNQSSHPAVSSGDRTASGCSPGSTSSPTRQSKSEITSPVYGEACADGKAEHVLRYEDGEPRHGSPKKPRDNGWRSFRTRMNARSVGKKVRTSGAAFARM